MQKKLRYVKNKPLESKIKGLYLCNGKNISNFTVKSSANIT